MPIDVACPRCQKQLRLHDKDAGSKGRCPGCQEVIDVPKPPAVENDLSQLLTAVAAAADASVPTRAGIMGGFRGRFESPDVTPAYRRAVVLACFLLIVPAAITCAQVALFSTYVAAFGRIPMWLIALFLCEGIGFFSIAAGLLGTSYLSKRGDIRTLQRSEQPQLFEFLDKICELVQAPPPRTVEVDMGANASASFYGGMRGFVSGELRLRFGMGLLVGLSLQQFAGVMAHEFGHFRQGGGMRLTMLLHIFNEWLQRIVGRPPAWADDAPAPRGPGELVKRCLWFAISPGYLIVGNLLQQMEFDADKQEALLAGSESFAITCRKLHELNWSEALADTALRDFMREGKLPNNWPRAIAALQRDVPPRVAQLIQKEIATGKTGLLDSHPCDRERIEAAKQLGAPGVYSSELPATALISNFEGLAREMTLAMYQHALDSRIRPQDLSSTDAMIEHGRQEARNIEALDRFWRGIHAVQRSLRLPSSFVDPCRNRQQSIAKLTAARQLFDDGAFAYRQHYQEYCEVDRQLRYAIAVAPVLRASIRPRQVDKFPVYSSFAAANAAGDRLQIRLGRLHEALIPCEAAQGDRLYHALVLLDDPELAARLPNAAGYRREAAQLIGVAGVISNQFDSLQNDVQGSLETFVFLCQMAKSSIKFDSLVTSLRYQYDRLRSQLAEFHEAFKRIDYPFDHARGRVSVSHYLFPGGDYGGNLFVLLEEAETFINRTNALYRRCQNRLTCIAEEVEVALGLPPLPPLPEEATKP